MHPANWLHILSQFAVASWHGGEVTLHLYHLGPYVSGLTGYRTGSYYMGDNTIKYSLTL